jgi:uncharacterized membrane protein YeaQ/YmgE (transglycosylase-associated protein family)
MFSLITWCVYGIFVGSIAKAIVPGEEKMGFIQTVFLGAVGSWVGGSLLYLIGDYSQVEPAGLFMGVVGSVISLVAYNKAMTKS